MFLLQCINHHGREATIIDRKPLVSTTPPPPPPPPQLTITPVKGNSNYQILTSWREKTQLIQSSANEKREMAEPMRRQEISQWEESREKNSNKKRKHSKSAAVLASVKYSRNGKRADLINERGVHARWKDQIQPMRREQISTNDRREWIQPVRVEQI